MGFVAIRYRNRLVTGLSLNWTSLRGDRIRTLGERVLIVGAGEVAQFALWLLRNGDIAQSFTVVGMVDDNPRKNGMQIDGCYVIGETKDIPKLVETLDIGMVIYAITNVQLEERERILSTCQPIPARLIMMPDILDTMRAYFPSDEKGRDQLFVKVLQNTTIDKLTGIYNSNQLLLLAEKERPRARRYGDPLSVLCIAVDYELPEGEAIKHMTANKVLQYVAEKCQSSIRDVDILGRYNSNEFVIVLPETDSQGAIRLAERLQMEIAKYPFQSDYGTIEVSLKIGISEYIKNFPDAVSLIESAKNSMKAYQ
jgi:diguanylate cyclase (GGDEF)-like protein